MRFLRYRQNGCVGLAVAGPSGCRGLLETAADYPGDLACLVEVGPDALRSACHILEASGISLDLDGLETLPPFPTPGKIICVGLNYADHSAESGFEVPDYPTLFARFSSSLIGHGAPIVRPRLSSQLDYEGEMVAVIGKGGRNIPLETALGHVAGYSIFNEASIRDYQTKAPQWTMGKNFDNTGAFGPAFVTADELPPGGKGLKIETRLNGNVVQSASTYDMIFDVTTLIHIISQAITLSPGDVLVTGTPAGVGLARKPPLWMKDGDVCEVEIESIGILRNPILDERA